MKFQGSLSPLLKKILKHYQAVAHFCEKKHKKNFIKSKKELHLHSQNNDSSRVLRKGTIAQLVEQRTENPCVAGSNPAGTTKSFVCSKLLLF